MSDDKKLSSAAENYLEMRKAIKKMYGLKYAIVQQALRSTPEAFKDLHLYANSTSLVSGLSMAYEGLVADGEDARAEYIASIEKAMAEKPLSEGENDCVRLAMQIWTGYPRERLPWLNKHVASTPIVFESSDDKKTMTFTRGKQRPVSDEKYDMKTKFPSDAEILASAKAVGQAVENKRMRALGYSWTSNIEVIKKSLTSDEIIEEAAKAAGVTAELLKSLTEQEAKLTPDMISDHQRRLRFDTGLDHQPIKWPTIEFTFPKDFPDLREEYSRIMKPWLISNLEPLTHAYAPPAFHLPARNSIELEQVLKYQPHTHGPVIVMPPAMANGLGIITEGAKAFAEAMTKLLTENTKIPANLLVFDSMSEWYGKPDNRTSFYRHQMNEARARRFSKADIILIQTSEVLVPTKTNGLRGGSMRKKKANHRTIQVLREVVVKMSKFANCYPTSIGPVTLQKGDGLIVNGDSNPTFTVDIKFEGKLLDE